MFYKKFRRKPGKTMDFVQKNVEKCSEMLYNESSWGSFSCPKFTTFN